MKATIVIPTYNEEENIGKLLDALFLRVFPTINGWNVSVIVVDGNSGDNTRQIVRDKANECSGLHLVSQSINSGIGGAYMEGFRYAINELRADVVMEFDADFQHPPESVKALLEKIEEGYDYVLGSRKIKGGGETYNRNVLRSIFTSFGGFIARTILFFPGKNYHLVTDPTTGLKATRVKGCLDKVDLRTRHLYSTGFAYKIQLLSEIIRGDARYAEIPLRFNERLAGESKMRMSTAWDILKTCVRCRVNAGLFLL